MVLLQAGADLLALFRRGKIRPGLRLRAAEFHCVIADPCQTFDNLISRVRRNPAREMAVCPSVKRILHMFFSFHGLKNCISSIKFNSVTYKEQPHRSVLRGTRFTDRRASCRFDPLVRRVHIRNFIRKMPQTAIL